MKHFLFTFFLFIFCSIFLHGQENILIRSDYVPFVDEGKVWYCGYWHPNRVSPVTPEDPLGVGIDCIFTMHGDTVINAREYKKVYCEFGEYYGDQEQHYYCAVREEACHVFIVEGDTQEEKLLYDFSSPKESKRITCNGVSLTRSAGQMFYLLRPNQNCYFLLSDETRPDFTPDDYAYWFEGLGARYNNPFAFELKVLPFDNPKLGNRLNVHTCMKDGKYIFNILWFSDPLGLTAVRSASINATETNTYGNFYDLQGRQLTSQPRKGIYIRDGRKVVVK